MTDSYKDIISGAGGGKNAPKTPYNAADNLDSSSIAKILDVLGEGEIAGFATPLEANIQVSDTEYAAIAKKDIYFNQTPLLKQETANTATPSEGDYNFDVTNLVLDSRTGLGDQDVINMFDQVRTEVTVADGDVAIPQSSPKSVTVVNASAPNNIARVQVNLSFPQLYIVEDDGDTRGVKVSYKIYVDNVLKINSYVQGRTNDLYQKQHVIDTSNITGNFVLKVERTTIDTPSGGGFVQYQGALKWASYTKIIDQSLKYNNTALVGIKCDAEQFSSIPKRTYKVKGTKIRIPGTGADGSTPTVDIKTGRIIYDSNYIFNGTMQNATFCSCPVFVLYDILTSKRYGYGHQILTEAEKVSFTNGNAENVDLYSFVTASKYCNTLVSNRRITPASQTGTWTHSNHTATITKINHELTNGDLVDLTFTGATQGYPADGTYVVEWVNANTFKVTGALQTSLTSTTPQNVTIVSNNQEPRFSFNGSILKQEEGFNLINKICSNFRSMAYWSEGKVKIVQDSPADSVYLFNRSNVTEEGFSYSGSDVKTRANLIIVRYFNNNQQKIDYVQHPLKDDVATDPYIVRYGLQKKQVDAFGCTSSGQASRMARWMYYSGNLLTETVSFTTTPDAGVVVRPGMIISISDPVRSGARYAGRIVSGGSLVNTVDAAPVNSVLSGDKFSVVLPDGTVQTRDVSNINGNIIACSAAFSDSNGDGPQVNSVWIYERTTVEPTLWKVISIKEVENIKYQITALTYNSSIYSTVESGTDIVARDITDLDSTPAAPSSITATESLYKKVAKTGSNTNTGLVGVQVRFSWPTVNGATQYKVEYRKGASLDTLDNPVIVPARSNELELRDVQTSNYYSVKVHSISGGGKISSIPATLTYQVIGKSTPPSSVGTITATIDKNDGLSLSWTPIVASAPNFADLDLAGYEIRKAAAANEDGSYTWTNASHPMTGVVNTGVKVQSNNVLIPIEHVKTTTTFLVKAFDDSGIYSTTPTSVTQTVSVPSAVPTTGTGSLSAKLAEAAAGYPQGSAIIQWSEPATSTYALSHYVISWTNMASETFSEEVDGTSYILPADWIGSQSFTVKAVDIVGNTGPTATVSLDIPHIAAPATLTSSFTTDSVLLQWTQGERQTNELPIKAWKVLQGGETIADIESTEILIPINNESFPESETTFTVKGVDINGTQSTNTTSITVTYSLPIAPSFDGSPEYELDFIKLNWTKTDGSIPTLKYELSEDEGDDIIRVLATVDSTSFNVRWKAGSTSRTFRVRALNAAYLNPAAGTTEKERFSGPVGIKTYTRSYIDAPVVPNQGNAHTLDVSGGAGFVTIRWEDPATSTSANLELKDYKIIRSTQSTYGNALTDNNAVVTFTDSNSYKEGISWTTGTTYYYVVSRDILNNTKEEALQIPIIINAPSSVPNANGTEVIDNNVLLRWSAPNVDEGNQLQISHYKIKKKVGSADGATWANSEEIGVADARFSVVFESLGGTYTYLIKAVDVAGNESAEPFKTEQVVAQPPDFVLNADHTSDFSSSDSKVISSTFSNCLVLADPNLDRNVAYMPVPTDSNGTYSKTWAQHFTGNASPQYANIQALITAGFSKYLQGDSSVTEGSYIEEYDYGTNLASSKITQHFSKEAIGSGTTTNSLQIDTTASGGGTYSAGTASSSNPLQRVGTNFGRVKYTTKLTTSNGGIAKITSLNLKIDSKTKNDTGTGTSQSTDSGGTTVNFTVDFIDVQGIVVTPNTTAAVLAVVDFTDIPNPTSFKVLLFNTSGVRVSGNFTWSARGS